MAVSKELLARYKEMKAKGINITLSELKQQLEAEANNPSSSENVSISEIPSNQSLSSGFSSLSSETPSSLNSSPQAENSWTTTYYNNSNEDLSNSNSENSKNSFANLSNETNKYSENSFSNLYEKPQSITSEQKVYSDNSFQSQTFGTQPQTFETQPQTFERELKDNNQADAINAPTRKYAVIGYPLGHSLSTYIHNAGFKSLGLKASYEILETPPEKLVDRIKFLKSNNYSGFNVTIPLKLPVLMFLNEIDVSADIVNAINTVTIDPDTKELKGYNTDVLGFRNAIPEDFTLCGKVGGVLGTGGAARAAITALAQGEMKEIKLYTRNVPNSLELVNHLRKTFPRVEFNTYQIERIRDLSEVNLLVNTTPIGMQGRGADYTPVEEEQLCTLPKDALVYDVIYNPKKTIFLKLAQKHGYRTVNGVDMFIHQAVEAEKIWTGRTPDFKDMKIAALENL